MDATFASRARAQKAIAKRNRTVRNLVYLTGVLLGVMGGVAWLVLVPGDDPKPQNKLAIGFVCGLSAAVVALVAGARLLFPVAARCPACGYDWEIKEGRSVQPSEQMQNWIKCPGCGAEMGEAVIHEAK